MGDLLDEILSEMEEENKSKDKLRWKRNNAARWERERLAKIKLSDDVGILLKKSPRDSKGRCIFCESVVIKRHSKNCPWLELFITYSHYKNKYLSGKRKSESKT